MSTPRLADHMLKQALSEVTAFRHEAKRGN
ncbi:hypothetical protein SAMN05216174_11494 [Actinokineospora iranica]|uniref:Uncharacterized protein n=1 Tax=Actinokineospora iranica TaxID=1271860 RepID=A0A1G6WAT0_9PSEU|nr:hypothetical protein SAMN05216174_11494 [Actinokineospora iranica]